MSDQCPKVSIVVVTHNRSQLLKEAVDSVLGQTYPNIETVIVDNGSTDDTEEVVQQYATRVRYIKQENLGVAAARNIGIAATNGKYVGVLDDDDTYLPTKIERQVAVLEKNPHAGLVHCRYVYTAPNGDWLETSGFLPEGTVLKELVCGCFLMVHTPLVRRQCFEEVGGFDPGIPWAADWDLWLRIARAGYEFAGTQEILCTYRMALGGTMMSNVARQEQETMTALGRVYNTEGIPGDVIKIKDQAYALNYLWLGGRYFGIHAWDEGWRCLNQSFDLYPALCTPDTKIIQFLCDNALGLRVSDPMLVTNGLMEHLPDRYINLRAYRDYLLGQVHFGLALKDFANQKIAGAHDHLRCAIEYDPILPTRKDQVLEMVHKWAFQLVFSSPIGYSNYVVNHLPEGYQAIKSYNSRLNGDIYMGMARECFWRKQYQKVPGLIFTSLRCRPKWALNRGTWGMLKRSLGHAVSGHSD